MTQVKALSLRRGPPKDLRRGPPGAGGVLGRKMRGESPVFLEVGAPRKLAARGFICSVSTRQKEGQVPPSNRLGRIMIEVSG